MNEKLYKVVNSTGVNSNYTVFIDVEKEKVSEPYFNLLFNNENMVAYMKERTIYLTDTFDGTKIYASISRDFTETAAPESAVLSFEMNDNVIYLSYLTGDYYEEKSEQIEVKI